MRPDPEKGMVVEIANSIRFHFSLPNLLLIYEEWSFVFHELTTKKKGQTMKNYSVMLT